MVQKSRAPQYLFSRVGPNSNYQYLLNEVRDGKGFKWTLTYQTQTDGKYRLTRITNNFGRYISISREPSPAAGYWRITGLTANDGRAVTFGYTTWTNTSEPVLASATYPGGEAASYTWAGSTSLTTGSPVLASAVDPMHHGSGSRCKYLYNYTASYPDSYGLVKGTILEEKNYDTDQTIVKLPNGGAYKPTIMEGNGTSVKREYSSVVGGNDNITKMSDGEGRSKTREFGTGGAGYKTRETDDAGGVTAFQPDFAGRITSKTDALGKTCGTTYSGNGFVLSKTDELNRTTTTTRNSSNQATRIDYPDGAYETFTYSASGLLLTNRLRSGANKSNSYDASGNLTSYSITYDNGNGGSVTDTTSYMYFPNGLCSSTTDPRNNTTTFLYDWRGHVVRTTLPGGPYRQKGYDIFGNVTSDTDELGHLWSKTYTEYNQLATSTDPLNRVTSYQYGQEPECSSCGYRQTVTRMTLPSGKRTEFTYDRSGKRLSAKAGAGTSDEATTNYTYDAVGNQITSTDPRGKITTYGYDLLHRKTTETDPLSHTTSTLYDDAGNKLRITRADTTYTAMTYDGLNRLLTTQNPNNEKTTFTYLGDGSLATLKDARNSTYAFTVDGRSRRTRMTYPGGSFENWTYDGVGNLIVYTARNGVTRTCTYDSRNRDLLCDWSDSTLDISKTYDDASRLLTLNNASSALTYIYDDANQLLSETQQISGGPGVKSVVYDYDEDGNRAGLIYPSSQAVGYRYTGRNQLSQIVPQNNPRAPYVSYQYDPAGDRVSKTLANGATSASTYDDANRVVNISDSVGLNTSYLYNSVNNRTQKTTASTSGPDQGEAYGFDAADQLTGASYLTGTTVSRTATYLYDAVGNRSSVIDGSLTTPYSVNALNQYTSIDGLAAPIYSTNGNLTNVQYPSVAGSGASSVWAYSYDSQNRLLSATSGSITATFAYDARNRRISRTINGATIFFVYDKWNLVEEYTGAIVQANYVHGGRSDEVLFRKDVTSGTRTYHHHDALGNIVALSDSTGSIVETYRYDAFGAPDIRNASGTSLGATAFENRFLFTGREYLQELGIYDYRNRQYSPRIGRFTMTDPIRFAANDVNLYRYVKNDPANFRDPTGLNSFWNLVPDFLKNLLDVSDPLDPGDLPKTVLPAAGTGACIAAKAALERCKSKATSDEDVCCNELEAEKARVCDGADKINDIF